MTARYIPLVRGRVTFLKPEQNYGFITTSAGEEVFFHRRACGDPWTLEDFKLGDKVVFNMVRIRRKGSQRQLRGFQVKKLDPKLEKRRQG